MEPLCAGDVIRGAIKELGLSGEQAAELPADKAVTLRARIEEKFLFPGLDWWWERMKSGVAFWMTDNNWNPFELLSELCPDVPAWFLPIYDDNGEVFSAHTAMAIKVLFESVGNECAIVAEDLSWIAMVNHHDVVFVAGDPIAARVLALMERPGARVEKFTRENP